MMALTKAGIAQELCDQLGVNKREAKELVELYFDSMRAILAKGEAVKMSGFGNFNIRDKTPRPGRNPKTGEEIPISARRVVTFKLGQKLKRRIESYAGAVE
ncbi:MAG: integration host factor subunit alpha [Immundisolibacteraceae bacterium]|nr:integration host factor subunit alpha [Immundisolibacteraceae bacterium]